MVNAAQRDMRELTRSRLGTGGRHGSAQKPHLRDRCQVSIQASQLRTVHRRRSGVAAEPVPERDRPSGGGHPLGQAGLLAGRIARYERRIAEIARDDPRARLLMTIPGIGYITAVTILAEIVDHGRFAQRRKAGLLRRTVAEAP